MFSVFPNQAILQDFLNLGSWQHQNNNSKMSQSDKAILWGQASFKNEMFCIPYATYFIVCYIWYLYFNTISVYLIYPIWYCGFQIQLVTLCFVYLLWLWLSTYSEGIIISNCSNTLLILNLIKSNSVFSVFLRGVLATSNRCAGAYVLSLRSLFKKNCLPSYVLASS